MFLQVSVSRFNFDNRRMIHQPVHICNKINPLVFINTFVARFFCGIHNLYQTEEDKLRMIKNNNQNLTKETSFLRKQLPLQEEWVQLQPNRQTHEILLQSCSTGSDESELCTRLKLNYGLFTEHKRTSFKNELCSLEITNYHFGFCKLLQGTA